MSGFRSPHPVRVVLQSGRPKMPVVDRRLVDQGCSVEAPIARSKCSHRPRDPEGIPDASALADRVRGNRLHCREIMSDRGRLLGEGPPDLDVDGPCLHDAEPAADRRVCGRDHTTVLHSTRKVEKIVRHFKVEMVESEREMIRALLQLDWTRCRGDRARSFEQVRLSSGPSLTLLESLRPGQHCRVQRQRFRRHSFLDCALRLAGRLALAHLRSSYILAGL